MKVSVITPNFNGENFLKIYFNSLFNHKDHIEEIIIIDNGSTDNSLNIINNYQKNLEYTVQIILIQNKENLGFAKAVNQGIDIAHSEFLFLLNNDIELEKNSISSLINTIKKDNLIFSVASKMIQFSNRNLIDDAGDEYTLLTYTNKMGNGQSINKYLEEREIFSSCAGASLYNKSLLIKLGKFDENFFAYMEDVDLAYRAQINGYKNIYCPNSIVYHVGSGSSGSKYNKFKIRLAARNNVWLIYKNFPLPQKIINFLFIIIGFLIKYLFFLRKGFGNVYLKGLKEGFNDRGKVNKVKYQNKNFKNYFKIEWRLFINTIKLLK